MTRSVAAVGRDETLQAAARRMREMDIGSLPVTDGQALAGMVTDRDITVRGVAEGMIAQEALVADVMTDDVRFCNETDSVEDVMAQMGDAQVRRLPVLGADNARSSASSPSPTWPRDNQRTPTKLCARSRRPIDSKPPNALQRYLSVRSDRPGGAARPAPPGPLRLVDAEGVSAPTRDCCSPARWRTTRCCRSCRC